MKDRKLIIAKLEQENLIRKAEAEQRIFEISQREQMINCAVRSVQLMYKINVSILLRGIK